MKKVNILFMALFTISHLNVFTQDALTGAWKRQDGPAEVVMLFQDGYYSKTKFDKVSKEFSWTTGGTYTIKNDQLITRTEFHSHEKEKIGLDASYDLAHEGNTIVTTIGGQKESWTRIDNGAGALAGNWRITGRMNNGIMQEMQPGARKTLKLLTGTRFQWMAINTETKEFFGTGGGVYTFGNGKYTEHIEFFSRDNARVGTSLSFDGSVRENEWRHSGLSSRGDPIDEIWKRNIK